MELDYYLVFQHQAFQCCSFLICEAGYKRRFCKGADFMWCTWCVIAVSKALGMALLEKHYWKRQKCLDNFFLISGTVTFVSVDLSQTLARVGCHPGNPASCRPLLRKEILLNADQTRMKPTSAVHPEQLQALFLLSFLHSSLFPKWTKIGTLDLTGSKAAVA